MSVLLKALILATVTLLLAGCEKPVSVQQQQGNYRVVSINPPKRFYVDLINVNTGERYNIYVAKRCSNWRSLKLGSVHQMTTEVSTYADGTKRTHFYNKASLCPRS